MLEKARYIVIEGPIGAGKTSLARRLNERLAATPVLEQPELNPFLARFYQDMERWALPTARIFYQRIDQLSSLQPTDSQRVVSDFLLDKDPLFAGLNLATMNWPCIDASSTAFDHRPPVPDLVVICKPNPKHL